MTTIADTIYDTINDNWGSGGYAGAAPAIDSTESQKSTDVVATDVVEVRHYSLKETGKQVNDTYVDRHYAIDVYISSKTSNAQLKLLYDEVEYLLRNTTMTGIQIEKIDKDWSVAQWERGRHSVILRVSVVAFLSSGAVTSASTSTTNFTVSGNLTVDGTSTLTGNVSVGGTVDGVDIAAEPARITAEIATHTAVAGAHHAKYTDAEVEAIITAELVNGQSIDNAIDSLITTHTAVGTAHTHALTDHSSYAHTDLSDTTLTGPYLEDLLMFGSTNSAFIPCALVGTNGGTVLTHGTTSYQWAATGTQYAIYLCPLPSIKGSLKLYVKDVKLDVEDADAAAYIDEIWIRGIKLDGAASNTVYTYTTNITAAGDYQTSNAAADDVSTYTHVIVVLKCVLDVVGELNWGTPRLECYYDT